MYSESTELNPPYLKYFWGINGINMMPAITKPCFSPDKHLQFYLEDVSSNSYHVLTLDVRGFPSQATQLLNSIYAANHRLFGEKLTCTSTVLFYLWTPFILGLDWPEEPIGNNGQTTVYISLHRYVLLGQLTHWASH